MTATLSIEATIANAKRSYKRCECHKDSGGHRFGTDLGCIRPGCEVTWPQHDVRYRLCEGGDASNWHPNV